MNHSQTTPYQPYRKFEVNFINQLLKQGSYYLVAQSYIRAIHEMVDHTKTPILFSSYKQTPDAVSHFEYLRNKGDNKAAYVDMRKNAVTAKIVSMCYGLSDNVPYLSLVKNLQQTNNDLARRYREQIRSWVRTNRELWDIREPSSLQPSLVTIYGEPWVRVGYGKLSAMVTLDELEKL